MAYILHMQVRLFLFTWEKAIYTTISMDATLYQHHLTAAKSHGAQEIMLFWIIFHLLHVIFV